MKIARLACCLIVAALAVACAPNPQSDCESACEEQRSRMCNGFTGDENCSAQCSNAQAEYDAAVDTADRIGCRSEFDSFYGCASGGDPCDSSRCNSELNAVQSCTVTYCMRNPTDSACT